MKRDYSVEKDKLSKKVKLLEVNENFLSSSY